MCLSTIKYRKPGVCNSNIYMISVYMYIYIYTFISKQFYWCLCRQTSLKAYSFLHNYDNNINLVVTNNVVKT